MSASLDVGTLVAHLGLDISELTSNVRPATQQLGKVEKAAAAVGGAMNLDRAIAGLAKLGQEGRRAQDLLDGPAEQLEHLAKSTGKSVADLQAELRGMVTEARKAGVQIGAVAEQAEDSGSKLQDLATKVGDLFSNVSPALGDAISGLGDKGKLAGAAIGTLLGAGLAAAVNAEPAKKKLVAQLALTPEEQKRISASAEGLFNGNYGEDLGQVNDAIKSVIQNIDGMRAASTEDLQAISGQAISLAATFEQDVGGVSVAVGQMLKTGLASNAQEALDILAAGFQAGNDKAGDLLDTVNEYSTQFRKAGVDGQTAMGLIQQGLQGGARDADLVADAIKEMTIKLQDGSALEGLNELGLNGNEVIAQFREGGPEAAAAMDLVIDKIRDTNAVTENLASVQKVAGTQVEDLGAAFNSLDLSTAAAQLGDVAGRSQDIDKAMGDTVAGGFAALKNQGITALTELGEIALPVLSAIVGGATTVAQWIGHAAEAFSGLTSPVGLGVGALAALVVIGPKIIAFLKTLPALAVKAGTSLSAALGPVGIVLGLATAAVALFGGSNADAEARVEAHKEAVDKLKGSIDGATGSFNDGALGMYAEKFAGFGNSLADVGVKTSDAIGLLIRGADDGGKSWEALRAKVAEGLDAQGVLDSSGYIADAVYEMSLITGRAQGDIIRQIATGGTEAQGLIDALTAKGGASAAEYGQMVDDTRGRIEKYAPAVEQVREETDAARAATTEATEATRAQAEAAAAATQATQDQAESNREGTRGLHDFTAEAQAAGEAHRETNAAARDGVVDADAYRSAVQGASGAVQDAAAIEAEAAAHKERLASQQDILNSRYEAAQAAADRAAEALSPFEQASQDAADAQSDLAKQTQEVTDALDRQAGRVPTLEEANAKAAATGDDLADSFKVGTAEVEKLGEAILNADGTVKTADEGGRKFRSGILDTREAMVAQAAAARDAALANGDSLAEASKKATDAQADTLAQLRETATQLGLTPAQIDAVVKAYGLVPTDVTTKLNANDAASAKIAAAKRAAEDFAYKTYLATLGFDTSRIDAQIAAANAKLSRLGQVSTNKAGPSQYAATGGAIIGPGTGTSDDILMMGSNGEHMLTAMDVVKMGGQPGVYRFREQLQKGNVPKYATGGAIGASTFSLAGNADPSYSGREGVTRDAIDDLLDAFKDLLDAAADAADEVRDTSEAYREAQQDLNEARHDRNAATSQARADIVEEKRERALAAIARRRAQSALTSAEGKADTTRAQLAKASDEKRRKALQKTLDAQVKDVADKSKDLTDARADENEQIRKLAAAQRAFNTTRSEEAVKVRQATAAVKAASTAANTAAAAKTRADAAAAERRRDLQATTAARTVLVGLARAADQTADKLADARDRLNDVRNSAAQMASSVAGSIAGFGGGILGNSEQRRTDVDVLRGLKFNESKVEGFGKNIDRLRDLGLSPALLDQIASAGVDGGGSTAAALAKSTPQMLRQINATVAATNTAAAKAGRTVADANFAKPIAGLTSTVNNLAAQVKNLRGLEDGIARGIRQQFEVIGGAKGLALLVRQGEKQIGRSGG